MAPNALEGKWALDRSDNFDAYLEKLGVPEERRQAVATAQPEMEVSVSDDVVTLKLNTRAPITIPIGQKFQHHVPGGNAVESLAEWEGDTLVIKSTDPSKPVVMSRQVVNGEFVVTMELQGVTCQRYFKKC